MIRTKDVREIVIGAMAQLAESLAIDIRDSWPNGAINPNAADPNDFILENARFKNIRDADAESKVSAEYHPGFDEVD